MKLDENTLRRGRFDVALKVRRISDLELAIGDMERTLAALTVFVASEERRTRITDVNHFAYSTAANAGIERSNRLKRSIAELKATRAAAVVERDRAQESFTALRTAAQ